ncbi:Transducin/WD40 repeat-like superfamily protein isoform 1 [Theobroma cacao]|uniref:Transducin/WD40 repeat-like superfamily protein isoform 1 n=1 Tax=Theobroma cacao TaxID=3641 RepID=A0A061FG52_THECC|nr:Transducin/WD40 repeat-like superfamily protein isoform 1 [Theobroma cacao]
MEHFQNDDLEYVVDDYYDVDDFEHDNPFAEPEPQRDTADLDSFDSDVEDDLESSKPKTDTSAMEARNGKDIQGIPWERLNFTRDKYRETRLRQYKNYENLSGSREEMEKECLQVEKGKAFYDFQFNTRLVKSTIVHFQVLLSYYYILSMLLFDYGSLPEPFIGSYTNCKNLKAIYAEVRVLMLHGCAGAIKMHCYMLRNLLWATSKHDVYLMQNYSVMHWSSLLHKGKEVLNVAKPIVPSLKRPGLLSQQLSRVQISTMAVKENLMVAGGFQGELICKYLYQPGVAFCTKLTTDDNAITNAVDVYRNPSGAMRVMAANNDAQIRIFDAETFASLNCFSFDWSVNNTSVSPDGKLLAVLGDSVECLIADAQSGKVTSCLKGHLDYSFASAWHPDGHILATGNQDTTCRLWDIRNLSKSLAVLKGRMGAIRAVKFTSDGRFLGMAEPADFVHVFDAESGYVNCQEIDLFGEIAGISFSPDTEALFVGVADRTYGSLLEFNRRRYTHYLDSIL